MSRPRLPAAAVAVVALVLLAGYAVLWGGVSQTDISTSDFTATYVGATLLREGRGAAVYDESVQAQLHAALIAPLRRGNLAFVNPPVAALVAVPLTLLPLDAAYRLWQVVQLGLLTVALVLVARVAPWPPRLRGRGARTSAVLLGLAGTGTLSLGLLGQWDGLSALGLAGAYALWTQGRDGAGGALLALTSALAKPHLAIGLAALLVGWRERRVLAGAAAGLLAVVALSLVVVGPEGVTRFAGGVVADARRWPLASMLGFTGLTGSWLGDGTVAVVLAACGSVAAVAVCVVVGLWLRGHREALAPCLAATTLLSLLASPHLLSHDLVLPAPMFVAMAAWAAAIDGSGAWPGRAGRAVLGGWMALSLAAALDLGSSQPAPPGRLVPWALLALAALLLWEVRSGGRRQHGGAPASLSPRPAR